MIEDKVMIAEPYTRPKENRLLTREETVQLMDLAIDDAENAIVSKLKRKGSGDRLEQLAQLDCITIIRERINARLSYADPINRK